MKNVITTVGTSIFTNYIGKEKKDKITPKIIKTLEDKSYSDYDNYKDDVDSLRKTIMKYVSENIKNLKDISAELKSLAILSKKHSEINVYLIATDSILSPLACDIIKEIINKYNNDYQNATIIFNKNNDIINDLQIKNEINLKNGLSNLIRRIKEITQGYYDNVIINITGGYKGIIPYLTIIGAINKCSIVYSYEDTNTLIHIPTLPIQINEDFFETYSEHLSLLDMDDILDNYNSIKNNDYQAWEDLENNGMIEISDNIVALSSIGKIFYESYKNKYFIFKSHDDVWEKIRKQEEIQRILKTKFYKKEARENKTENKNSHLVYDDGNNDFRILYFIEKNVVYIYKTFENEEKQKKYIKTASHIEKIKDEIIKNSKTRILVKE